MKPNLKTFLDDLYQIDPALREHEAELVPLVEKLLHHDPATAPDEAFVSKLRMELQGRAAELSVTSQGFFTWQKLFFALGGGAVALLAVVIATGSPLSNSGTKAPVFGYQVSKTDDAAFGPLNGINPLPPATPTMSRDQSGGGGMAQGAMAVAPAMEMANTMMIAPSTGVGGGMSDAKMIAPYPMTNYNYVLSAPIKDLQATVDVFKHQPKNSNVALSAIASRLNLGTVDLSSFANATLDSVSFSQNVPLGYQMTVNMRDASLSINAQWDQWPQSKCQTEECYQSQLVKIGDVLSNEELIAIAQKFITDHDIDLTNYGTPEVDNSWRLDYDRSPDKSTAYIPESMRVVFPLLLDGNPAYDQGGAKMGLSLGVSVKQKKVMDVWGIGDRTYVKSSYEGVTDEATILKYLNNLNGWPVHIMENVRGAPEIPEGQNVTVTLSEPTVGYALFYKQNGNISEELFIPSLIFQVKETKGAADIYFRQTIVVPLAKDMLEQQTGGIGRPMPVDAPMMDNVKMK
jgi:hypothetical protein